MLDGATGRIRPGSKPMANPYLGEIRMFAGAYAPAGWALCDGQMLAIDGNEMLFQMLGTTYGGDGKTSFALPDLRGRLPVHAGPGFALGHSGGVETVALTAGQIPAHTHVLQASTTGKVSSPAGNLPAVSAGAALSAANLYATGKPDVSFNEGAIEPAGASQPHDNMHPFLAVTFIISLSSALSA
jgi:microcystin-dependent protein